MIINLMWAMIIVIPVWVVVLSVWYIFNDRIAEVAEIQDDAKLCHNNKCTAPRCQKQSLAYV